MNLPIKPLSGPSPALAFVTPWYGAEIPGGAEALARRTVEQLRHSGFAVEVWTTTIGHLHTDWDKNEHRPGLHMVNGVPVRRFAVRKGDRDAFNDVNWRLMNGMSITSAEEQTFIGEMFHCPDLYHHIQAHGAGTLLFFVGYMFASTYYGAQIYPGQSFIIPCLHDEAYAYLSIYRPVLRAVHGLIFNSAVEQKLARRLLGDPQNQRWQVMGMGIDDQMAADAERFRQKYDITSPFVLYVGRREPGKNTPLLLDYWQRYVAGSGRDVKLVLAGPGAVQIPHTLADHVLDLGFISVQDKLDAYSAAAIFCQPSVHESFSIVLQESWRSGTPALVHGDCPVTLHHCRQSNGGLYFTNYDEFAATLDYLLDRPQIRQLLGRQGRHYVLQNFHWDVIIEKYRLLIERLKQQPLPNSLSVASNQ